ncbi:hypothetical protein ACFL4O_01575, partial [bacterium]
MKITKHIISMLLLGFFSLNICADYTHGLAQSVDLELSAGIGRSIDKYKGEARRPYFYIIYDLHCHKQAQKNIEEIIKHLNSKVKIGIIGLEGAWEHIDVSIIKNMPDNKVKQKLLENFLEQGIITGAELYAILEQKEVKLKGIEDKFTYMKNLNELYAGNENKTDYMELINELLEVIRVKQDKLLNKKQKKFIRIIEKNKKGAVNENYYLKVIEKWSEYYNIPLKNNYINLYLTLKSNIGLKGLNINSVRHEADIALKKINNIISKKEIGRLQRLKGKEIEEYCRVLNKVIKQRNIDLKGYKNLRKYFKYLELAGRINKFRLVEELRELEWEIKEKFGEDNRELHELIKIERYLGLRKGLKKIDISYRQYEEYRQSQEERENLFAKFSSQNKRYRALVKELKEMERTARLFYRTADKRNEIMTANMLKHIFNDTGLSTQYAQDKRRFPMSTGNKEMTGILVVGGFHVQGITRILRSRGIGYEVLMPVVTEEIDKSIYWARINESYNLLQDDMTAQGLVYKFISPVIISQEGRKTRNKKIKEVSNNLLGQIEKGTASLEEIMKTLNESKKIYEKGKKIYTKILKNIEKKILQEREILAKSYYDEFIYKEYFEEKMEYSLKFNRLDNKVREFLIKISDARFSKSMGYKKDEYKYVTDKWKSLIEMTKNADNRYAVSDFLFKVVLKNIIEYFGDIFIINLPYFVEITKHTNISDLDGIILEKIPKIEKAIGRKFIRKNRNDIINMIRTSGTEAYEFFSKWAESMSKNELKAKIVRKNWKKFVNLTNKLQVTAEEFIENNPKFVEKIITAKDKNYNEILGRLLEIKETNNGHEIFGSLNNLDKIISINNCRPVLDNIKKIKKLQNENWVKVRWILEDALPLLIDISKKNNLGNILREIEEISEMEYLKSLFQLETQAKKKLITDNEEERKILYKSFSEIAKLDNAEGIFNHGIPAVQKMINKNNYKQIFELLTKISREKHGEQIFDYLYILRNIITVNNINSIINEIRYFYTAGGKYEYEASKILQAVQKNMTKKFDLSETNLEILRFINNTNNFNRAALVGLLEKQILPYLESKKAPIMRHLRFYNNIIETRKHNAYILLKEIFTAIKERAVDIALNDKEQKQIFAYMDELKVFNKEVYAKIKKDKNVIKGIKQYITDKVFIKKVLEDNITKEDIKEILADEYFKDFNYNEQSHLLMIIFQNIIQPGDILLADFGFKSHEEYFFEHRKIEAEGTTRYPVDKRLKNVNFAQDTDYIRISKTRPKNMVTMNPNIEQMIKAIKIPRKNTNSIDDKITLEKIITEYKKAEKKYNDSKKSLNTMIKHFARKYKKQEYKGPKTEAEKIEYKKREEILEQTKNRAALKQSEYLASLSRYFRHFIDFPVGWDQGYESLVVFDEMLVKNKQTRDILVNVLKEKQDELIELFPGLKKMLKTKEKQLNKKMQSVRNVLEKEKFKEIKEKILEIAKKEDLNNLTIQDLSEAEKNKELSEFLEKNKSLRRTIEKAVRAKLPDMSVDMANILFKELEDIIKVQRHEYEKRERADVKIEIRVVNGLPHSALAVINTGNCVPCKDIDLGYGQSKFFYAAIINASENKVEGYISLFETEINGKKVLTVPGIEPGTAFISKIKDQKHLLYNMIERALIKIGDYGKYDHIYIPSLKTEGYVTSNREDIVNIIRKKVNKREYKEIKLQQKVKWTKAKTGLFSGSYSFDRVYELKETTILTQFINAVTNITQEFDELIKKAGARKKGRRKKVELNLDKIYAKAGDLWLKIRIERLLKIMPKKEKPIDILESNHSILSAV